MMRIISLTFLYVLIGQALMGQWVNLNTSISGDLTGVYFTSSSVGLVVGETGIYSTFNGGTTWSRQYIQGNPVDSLKLESTKLNDVFCYATTCYAVGKDTITGEGVVFTSPAPFPILTYSWSLSHVVPGKGLNGVGRYSGGVVVVGDQGMIQLTTNNGATWTLQSTNATSDLVTTFGTYPQTTFAGGPGAIVEKISSSINPWRKRASYDMKDLAIQSGQRTMYGVTDNSVVVGSGSRYSEYKNFYGPLDGNAITFSDVDTAFIGTDHGIYRSVDNNLHWEILPSANNYQINDIYFPIGIGGAPIGFAVGPNGLVLKTTNRGGNGEPYIVFDSPNGGCVDSLIHFENEGPQTYTYSWKKNHVPFSSNYSIDHVFQSAGIYTITLVASNGQLIDSVEKTFQIVPSPDVSKSRTISDSILCKSGNTDITLHLSDPGIEYNLYRLADSVVVSTAVGNGGNIILNTGQIGDSTSYLISAKSLVSDCEIFFQDSILIAVEKTLASFHSVFVNADILEPVQFYNNSKQASTYVWQFGSNATPSISSLAEPLVDYSLIGPTQVTLVATSQYGCVDTVTHAGPFIYNSQSVIDDCWALNFDGNKLDIYEHDRGEEIKTTRNGDIIVSGSYSEVEFNSKAGVTQGRHFSVGFFIARYTQYGVLKWVVRGVDQDSARFTPRQNYSYIGSAFDLALDKDDNIYVSGWVADDFLLYSNDGKIIPLDEVRTGMIMKLDSNGVYNWHAGVLGTIMYSIGLDDSSNVYCEGRSLASPIIYSSDSTSFQAPASWGNTGFIFKLNSSGIFQWATNFRRLPSNNGIEPYDLAISKKGDVYITGDHYGPATFYSVTGGSISIPNTGPGKNAFVARYDPSGNIKWAHSIASVNGFSQTQETGYAIEVADDGNCYIALTVDSDFSGEYVLFPSSNSRIDTLYAGRFALASYDSSGNYRWGNGFAYANGRGTAVTVDDYGYVYATGYLFFGSPPGVFTSTDTTTITIPVVNGSYFNVKYDHMGRIIWAALESGLTSNNAAVNIYPNSNAVDRHQNLYVTGELWRFSGAPGYVMATDTLYPNQQDAFMARFSASACLQPDSIIPLLSSGTYCSGTSLDIPFVLSPNIVLNPGNVYHLQLSDSTGSFQNPQVIGSLNSTNLQDTITAFIPHINHVGRYQIRVVASQPQITGNQTSIFLHPQSLSIPQYVKDTICFGDTIFLQANSGTSYSWYPGTQLTDSTIQSTMAFPDSAITYLVDVTDFCGVITDTFDISVGNPSSRLLPALVICANDSALIFGTYRKQPGMYADTLITSLGCDSILSQQLTVRNVAGSSVSETVCDSYVSPSGNQIWTTSGVYQDTIPASTGCDSILTINLTVNLSAAISIADTACDAYLSPSGNQTWTASGIYTDIIPTSAGCDSTMTIDLVINSVDTSLTITPTVMTSNANGAIYQWLDCSLGFVSIANETNQTFAPQSNGTYAVEVTQNGCVDTSVCIPFMNVGIYRNDFGKNLTFYPNATKGNLTIDLGHSYRGISVFVRNIHGQEVESLQFGTKQKFNFEIKGSPGIYFIEIQTLEMKSAVCKVLKE